MFKYGLYEVFKDTYMNVAGPDISEKYKGAIWLAGSASAEVFADIALCPLEMTKVKIQTSPTGTFPIPFATALSEMNKLKVETRFPFGSLVPLWSRQVRSRKSQNMQCLLFPAIDPLYYGEVLFLREDRPVILHARVYQSQGNL